MIHICCKFDEFDEFIHQLFSEQGLTDRRKARQTNISNDNTPTTSMAEGHACMILRLYPTYTVIYIKSLLENTEGVEGPC